MKIRKGFVSNSSSSSFVILGYLFKNKDIDPEVCEKLCEDRKIHCQAGSDGGLKDDEFFVGVNLCTFDECCGVEEKRIPFFEFKKYIENIDNVLTEYNLKSQGEIQVITGNKLC